MIDIKKNSINKISIDIDQYEYYLIEFTSDSNCESVTAIFSNYGFNCDYPIIQIEETNISNIDVLLGKINLPYLGFWSANIYGNIDGVNLDTGLATFLIEEDVRVYKGVQEEYVDNNNYLIVENNLSDVDNVTSSQTNLNVYDKDDVYTKTEVEGLIGANLGYVLENEGSRINLTSANSDRAVSDNTIPLNTGEVFVCEVRFTNSNDTAYAFTTGGATGLLLGTFGDKLLVGFNGGGNFTTSVKDFSTSFNGTDLKMVYTKSTGDLQVYSNGNKMELVMDSVNSGITFFGDYFSLGSRYSPANNFMNGVVDYFRVTIDDVPIVDYAINEGSGTTITDSISGHDLTLEGSSYAWSDVVVSRRNSVNIILMGDSNSVGRTTIEELNEVDSEIPTDGNIDSIAYWDGENFAQSTTNMNLGGDVGVGLAGIDYPLGLAIKENLGMNLNLLKYGLGGSQCTDGGGWDATSGALTKGLIEEVNKSRISYDAIICFLGENSATNPTDSGNYEADQIATFNRFRSDLLNQNNIPIILIRLYDFEAANIIAEVPTIQAAQDSIGASERNTYILQPSDIMGVKSDDAHYDQYGIVSLGRNIFKMVKRLV